MKRAALYVRVSTEEQKKHGLSVDSQITALQDYVNENGLIEAGIYNDAGISARKKYTNRPELLRLISDCKAGKIDVILFTKLDRWFRSVGDYYEVQNILDECRVPWRAIWEDYEIETSAGIFKTNIMLAVAQSEADRTSERIKSVFEYKRAQGQHLGGVPFGYVRVNGKLEKDEKKAELVERIFDCYLRTHSQKKCTELDGFVYSKHVLTRILKNPVYTGVMSNGFTCPAYITREQYDEIQKINSHPSYSLETKNIYLFSSLLICSECGRHLGSGFNIMDGVKYYRYTCTGYESKIHHKNLSVSEKKFEKYMLDNLEKELSNAQEQMTLKTDDKAIKLYDKKIDALNTKLERIGIRFELGDLSIEEYKNKRQNVLDEIQKLANQRPQTEMITVELTSNWIDMYTELSRERKKEFWLGIIDSIEISRNWEKNPIIKFK